MSWLKMYCVVLFFEQDLGIILTMSLWMRRHKSPCPLALAPFSMAMYLYWWVTIINFLRWYVAVCMAMKLVHVYAYDYPRFDTLAISKRLLPHLHQRIMIWLHVCHYSNIFVNDMQPRHAYPWLTNIECMKILRHWVIIYFTNTVYALDIHPLRNRFFICHIGHRDNMTLHFLMTSTQARRHRNVERPRVGYGKPWIRRNLLYSWIRTWLLVTQRQRPRPSRPTLRNGTVTMRLSTQPKLALSGSWYVHSSWRAWRHKTWLSLVRIVLSWHTFGVIPWSPWVKSWRRPIWMPLIWIPLIHFKEKISLVSLSLWREAMIAIR